MNALSARHGRNRHKMLTQFSHKERNIHEKDYFDWLAMFMLSAAPAWATVNPFPTPPATWTGSALTTYSNSLSNFLGQTFDLFNGWLTDPVVDVRQYNSLNDAVNSIGSSQKTLLISSACTVTTSITFPPTLQVVFTNGGSITRTGPYGTLNFNTIPLAPPSQIFFGFVQGNIIMSGYAGEVESIWWGTLDDSFAIASYGSPIITLSGGIQLSSSLTASSVVASTLTASSMVSDSVTASSMVTTSLTASTINGINPNSNVIGADALSTGDTSSTVATLSSISVTSGDVLYIEAVISWSSGSTEDEQASLHPEFSPIGGTPWNWIAGDSTFHFSDVHVTGGASYNTTLNGIIKINTTGTLSVTSQLGATSPTIASHWLGYVFLRKQ